MRHRLGLQTLLGAGVGALLGVLLVSPPAPVARVLRGVAWQTTAPEARQMLSTVLGIALTSLSIVLSLSMVVVQSAAGQYSPRLLRHFVHGVGFRWVIPVFVATSVFCLVAAHMFGFITPEARAPRPALAVALLLLLVCEVALIAHVLHMLQLMRVENLTRLVRKDTLEVARTLDVLRAGDVEPPPPVRPRPREAWSLRSPRDGFIATVDAQALLAVAESHRLGVHLERAVGEPVVQGEELGWVEEEGPPARRGAMVSALLRAIRLDLWRDGDMDIALGVRQLVDVAVRALSPGINDPYTAVEAVDQLTFLLCSLSQVRLGRRVLADSAGVSRVFLQGLSLGDYRVLVTDQTLRYGATEPAVVLRLLRMVAAMGHHAREAVDREAAPEALRSILAAAEEASPGARWLPLLRQHAQALLSALQGAPWPPLPVIGF
ncbi:DUF2254 domain-containing protein [Citreicoccus inhibens]|uniref:DUF2254 domain-containing protein n=1 Tax=Citreicoccus inhibens TaxID=2849499 RepID=UPI001EEF8313|nr:DUF2254 family protein [Citreicoccus inhibens]